MPFIKEELLKNILDTFSLIQSQVQLHNGVQYLDMNQTLEGFCAGLLNLVYGWSLVNLNYNRKNYPAIDLGDTENRVAVQITSTPDGPKVKETITKFLDNQLYKQYSRLVVFVTVPKQKSYTFYFETKGCFDFSIDNDIIDLNDLGNTIKGMQTEQVERIAKYINKEVSHGQKHLDAGYYDRMKNTITMLSKGDYREIAIDVKILFGEKVNNLFLKLVDLVSLQEIRRGFLEFYENELETILSYDSQMLEKYRVLCANAEQYEFYEPLYNFCDSYQIRVQIPYDTKMDELINYRNEHQLYCERMSQIEQIKQACITAATEELKNCMSSRG